AAGGWTVGPHLERAGADQTEDEVAARLPRGCPRDRRALVRCRRAAQPGGTFRARLARSAGRRRLLAGGRPRPAGTLQRRAAGGALRAGGARSPRRRAL